MKIWSITIILSCNNDQIWKVILCQEQCFAFQFACQVAFIQPALVYFVVDWCHLIAHNIFPILCIDVSHTLNFVFLSLNSWLKFRSTQSSTQFNFFTQHLTAVRNIEVVCFSQAFQKLVVLLKLFLIQNHRVF